MKTIKSITNPKRFAILAIFVFAANASATLILDPFQGPTADPSNPNGYLKPPGLVSGNDDTTEVENQLGLTPGSLTQLWKNEGGADLVDLIGVSVSPNIDGNQTTHTITVDGSPVVGAQYLAQKSGSKFAIWDLSGWDGIMDIVANGFDGDNDPETTTGANGIQGISHLSIYGTESVPDSGTTLILLVGSLGALALKRRRSP